MRIEVIKAPSADPKEASDGFALAIDGQIVPPTLAVVHNATDADSRTAAVEITDRSFGDRLLNASASDLQTALGRLYITRSHENGYASQSVVYDGADFDWNGAPAFSFHFQFDTENFKQLWSMREYTMTVERLLVNHPIDGLQRPHDPLDFSPFSSLVFGVELEGALLSTPLADFVSRWEHQVTALHERARLELAQNVRPDAVVAQFSFPSSVRVACEQYLVYFIQFLAEVGIAADADISQQAGQVLFSVVPREGPEALAQIRKALDVYLELPGAMPPGLVSFGGMDIPTQQLVANLQHLNGQLMLAAATIQTQQALIAHQQHLVSGEVVSRSLQSVTVRQGGQETTEAILGGTVRLVPYKGKGFEVDVPRLYRTVRKFITGHE